LLIVGAGLWLRTTDQQQAEAAKTSRVCNPGQRARRRV
jgi:hypothetical protein